MAKNEEREGFWIVSPAEKEEELRLKKREEMLARLKEASAKRLSSTKNKSTGETKEKRNSYDFSESPEPIVDQYPVSYNPLQDMDWDILMNRVEDERLSRDISPIEETTDTNIFGYYRQNRSDDDKYAKMFNDEIAMVSEVLKELREMGKLVNGRLKSMTGKGAGGGAPKSYSDLVSAASTIQSNKLAAIDKIANYKLKKEELILKVKKESGETEEKSVDELVDQYYSRLLQGGSSDLTSSAVARALPDNYQLPTERQTIIGGDDSCDENDPLLKRQYRITDFAVDEDTGIDYSDGDPYGYIANEGRNVEICLQRFPSGRTAFVALDADGESVDDYELPGDDLLKTMSFSPMSKYATDQAGRKYRIIDFNTVEDLSDLDEYDGYE